MKSFSTGLGAHATSLRKIIIGKYRFDPEAPPTALRAQAERLALYVWETSALLGEAERYFAPLTMRYMVDGKIAFVPNMSSGTVTTIGLTSMTMSQALSINVTPDPVKKHQKGVHRIALVP